MAETKKIKILILEDSPTQAVELEYILENGGYSFATVINGKDALKYLNNSDNIRPDIIISDIIMPEMNGFEFCRAVKNVDLFRNIPVVLLTSLSDPTDVISGLECGADNFITKPYKSDYLLARIKHLLLNFELRKNQSHEEKKSVKIEFAGKNYHIESGKTQILDLLISSFENAVQKNDELNITVDTLKKTQQNLIQAKEMLNQLATHDPLTDIYNRRAFKEIATKMIALSNRKKRRIAVFHIDIDNFKSINDSLGHDAGDTVLKSVAQNLNNILRQEDITGRIGGDEFAVVLMDLKSFDEAFIIAKKVIDSFKTPLKINNEEVFTTLSLGIAISKDGSESNYSELLKEADMAMYEAKKNGKSQFKLFNRQIKEKYDRKHKFEEELENGIRKNEFYMVYQPIINLFNNKVVGVESLVRWKNNIFGNVPPDEFIRFSEDTKQIHDIGHLIMDEVLRQCSEWGMQMLKEKFVSFNISPVQFERSSFVSQMINSITEYKINPKNIVIEITETAFSQFLKAETMLKMSEKDILIAIDDFGSGYSSMHRLLELPIDYMKIDGEYIREAVTNKKYQDIIKNILNIAKSLNIRSIAESVETKEQAEFLKKNGCDYVQGYYYHKPMKPDEVIKLLK